jgi:hypothetical protein
MTERKQYFSAGPYTYSEELNIFNPTTDQREETPVKNVETKMIRLRRNKHGK